MKSPLVMGNDLRKLTPASVSLLQNPAVLSVSQDIQGTGAERRWRYYVEMDEWDQCEIQLRVGPLNGPDDVPDQPVLLVNAGNVDRRMNATLQDVF